MIHLDRRAITPAEYRDKETEIQQAVTKTGYFDPMEKHYIRKDGSRSPVLLNGLNIKVQVAGSLSGPWYRICGYQIEGKGIIAFEYFHRRR